MSQNATSAGTGTLFVATPQIAASAEPGYQPASILGYPVTSTPIIGGVGDSITAGIGDAHDDVQGQHWGWFERAFANFSRVNIARAGEFTSTAFNTRSRRKLIEGCTHIMEAYGSNDLALIGQSGTNVSGLQGTKIALWNDLASTGAKVYSLTVFPRTAPGANAANTAAARTNYNTWMRDGAPIVNGAAVAVGTSGAARAPVYDQTGSLVTGASGPAHPLTAIFNLTPLVETAVDSNLWITGMDNSDTTHPSAVGAAAIASGVPLSLFTV
jgi:hypothetical protein